MSFKDNPKTKIKAFIGISKQRFDATKPATDGKLYSVPDFYLGRLGDLIYFAFKFCTYIVFQYFSIHKPENL